MMEYTLEETPRIVNEILNALGDGNLIFLHGELGAGKTTLTSNILKELASNSIVSSPTFTLMRSYPTDKSDTFKNVHHYDLYRLRFANELDSISIVESIEDPNTLVIVEWPELLDEIGISPDLRVFIEHLAMDRRKVRYEKS